jgi:hypothetical protein
MSEVEGAGAEIACKAGEMDSEGEIVIVREGEEVVAQLWGGSLKRAAMPSNSSSQPRYAASQSAGSAAGFPGPWSGMPGAKELRRRSRGAWSW